MMKRMERSLAPWALFACGLLAATAAGCGGDSHEPGRDSGPVEDASLGDSALGDLGPDAARDSGLDDAATDDLGASDLGASDLGVRDLGASDLGASDLGAGTDGGMDVGTATDQGADVDMGATMDGGASVDQGTTRDAGVTVCRDNGACGRSRYCERPVGECSAETGICAIRPLGCPDIYDPVCGCDGQTWGNSCEAASAGVNVATVGQCPTPCRDNAACGDGSYCAKPLGMCAEEGECQLRPRLCPLGGIPVCGCDGTTYDNACFAASAGVNAEQEGACGTVTCDLTPPDTCCYDDLDCASVGGPVSNRRCVGETCTRDGAGTCVDANLALDQCWENSDCGGDGVCVGAQRCECGVVCLLPDAPGNCLRR